MTKPRVIALYRVSTEDQAKEDRAGLLRQRDSVARTVAYRNLEVIDEIELVDVSGSDVQLSPRFAEMMRKVKCREIDGVVVADLDRLMRPDDIADIAILDTFRRAAVTLHTENSVHDQTNIEGILNLRLNAILGGHEKLLIKKRCQDAKESKRRQGKCPSAKMTLPLGIEYDRKAETWLYNDEVEKVKEAFRLIDEDGITNLTTLAERVSIQPRTLWNLLRNPIYAGWRVYDKKRGDQKYASREGKQADRRKVARTAEDIIRIRVLSEPAVAEDRFQRVQSILAEKGAKWRRQRESTEINLGTGLAVCGHCGRKLYTSSGRRANRKRQSYYCCAANYYLNKRKGSSCLQPNIRQDHLDKTLVAFVADYLTREEVLATLATAFNPTSHDGGEGTQATIRKLEGKKTRLIEAYEDGIIEKDELSTRLNAIKTKIQAANRLTLAVEERTRRTQEAARNLRLLAKAAVGFKAITTRAEQQTALRGLFASVAFEGPAIVGFVPTYGVSPAVYTENGNRTDTDSWPPPA